MLNTGTDVAAYVLLV